MRKALEVGGAVAAVVLIAFGIAAIAMGIDGKSTVEDNLGRVLTAAEIAGMADDSAIKLTRT